MRFLDIVVRQAHPGGARGPYRSFEQKLEGAREFARLEQLAWPMLVDDLAGTVHQSYGGMADSLYLLDAAGRVAFYGMWAHPPSLQVAIEELLAKGGTGSPVGGGIDRAPHLFASFVGGWRGLSRGGAGGVLDFELAVPGASTLTFLGWLARPALAPLAIRATPLPAAAPLVLGSAAAVALIGLGVLRRHRSPVVDGQ